MCAGRQAGGGWYNGAMDQSEQQAGAAPPPLEGGAGLIYMVDDDALLRRSLGWTLAQAGFGVAPFPDAETALHALAAVQAQRARLPDLVLLDIGLPGMDGLDALRTLHRRLDLPVIFVTARRRELEQVLGLELGADDYITKPFDSDVLVARIRAVLRRRRAAPGAGRPDAQAALPGDALLVGDLLILPGAHQATVGSRALELSPREFALLLALARRAEQVVAVEELLQSVWGAGYEGEPQVVYVHVRRLRAKLEQDAAEPQRLLTVRGVGYKLVAPAPAAAAASEG